MKSAKTKKENYFKKDVSDDKKENVRQNKTQSLKDEKINSYCTFNFFNKLDKMFENINKIYTDSLLIEWQNNIHRFVKSVEIDKNNFDSRVNAIKRLNFYIENFQNGIKEFVTDIKETAIDNNNYHKILYLYDEDMDILYQILFLLKEDSDFYSFKVIVTEVEE